MPCPTSLGGNTKYEILESSRSSFTEDFDKWIGVKCTKTRILAHPIRAGKHRMAPNELCVLILTNLKSWSLRAFFNILFFFVFSSRGNRLYFY